MKIQFLLIAFLTCFYVFAAHGIFDPSIISDGGEERDLQRNFRHAGEVNLSEVDDFLLGNMLEAEAVELNNQEENISSLLGSVRFLLTRAEHLEEEKRFEMERKYTEINNNLGNWNTVSRIFFSAVDNRGGSIGRELIDCLNVLTSSIENIRRHTMNLFREVCEICPVMGEAALERDVL